MPVVVLIPGPLRPFADGRDRVTLERAPDTVGEALAELAARSPGVRDRVVTAHAEIRPHVNVFVREHPATRTVRDARSARMRDRDPARRQRRLAP